jgi:hypothetical protein
MEKSKFTRSLGRQPKSLYKLTKVSIYTIFAKAQWKTFSKAVEMPMEKH